MMAMAAAVSLLLVGFGHALDNGVGQTPAMGYNTWDDFVRNRVATHITII